VAGEGVRRPIAARLGSCEPLGAVRGSGDHTVSRPNATRSCWPEQRV